MLNRAYSRIDVKEVTDDGEFYTIKGMATTPKPDRVNDVVEPLGATFAETIPLLWMHDNEKPVGTTQLGKPTKKGIPFTAKVPVIKEAGVLKDRIDEAIQSIRYRLVAAVSIGFRILNDAIERIAEGGFRYLETEILELSLVTIPAQPDAKITGIKSIDSMLRSTGGSACSAVTIPANQDAAILTVKSIAQADKATTGQQIRKGVSLATQKPPGVSGCSLDTSMKTLQEQIAALEAARAAKAARMEEVINKSVEEGRSTDSAESEEFDTLKGEVAALDSDIERLKSLEKIKVAKAQPLQAQSGSTQEKGTEARSPHVLVLPKKLEKGIAFARFVGSMAVSKGNALEAMEFAKHRFPEEKPLHDMLKMFSFMDRETVVKAAVAAGTSTDTTWAAPLVQYQQMTEEFIDYLRPQTILGKIQGLRRVPFNIRIPRLTSGGSASWVGEGAPKPVTSLAFDNVTMRFTKLATIAVITEELARFSSPSAEGIIRDTLAGAIIQQMDADFVDPDNAGTTDVKPAAITYGVTGLASAGNSEANVRTDVAGLFAPFVAANMNPANGVWIMSATTALRLSLMQNALGQAAFPGVTLTGGTFLGLPVIVSENAGITDSSANGHIVILVHAPDILLADDGQISVDVSREAAVQMNTTPDNPASASTVFTSLWQNNMVGIRLERYVNWAKARATAVSYMLSVNWGQ